MEERYEEGRTSDRSGGAAPGGGQTGGGQSAGTAPGVGGGGGGRPGGGVGGGDAVARNRQEKIDFVHRFFEALNRRDYQAIQGMISMDHTDHTWFGKSAVRPQAVTRLFSMIQSSSPDWTETVDEILAVDGDWVIVRATGRGTLQSEFLGMKPDGRQIASPFIHCVRVVNGKAVEYRSMKLGGFENPFTEQITAPEDIQEARAEQGGSVPSSRQLAERQRLVSAFAAGQISADDLAAGLTTAAEPPRCQALLPENLRRCLKPAVPGGIYCEIHQNVDPVHNI